jgi:hypothetical protein
MSNMGVALSVATVALAGATFMVRFLIALLHECKLPNFLNRLYSGTMERRVALEESPRIHYGARGGQAEILAKLVQKEKQQSPSLVRLDVQNIAGLEWQTVPSKSRHIFQKHRS